MGVPHRHLDPLVPHQLLDGGHVDTGHHEPRSEGVPAGVWRHVASQTGSLPGVVKGRAKILERLAVAVEKDVLLGLAFAGAKTMAEKRLLQPRREGDRAELAILGVCARDRERAAAEVDLRPPQGKGFGCEPEPSIHPT